MRSNAANALGHSERAVPVWVSALARSTICTLKPARSSAIAAVNPAIPAPTTTTSVWCANLISTPPVRQLTSTLLGNRIDPPALDAFQSEVTAGVVV